MSSNLNKIFLIIIFVLIFPAFGQSDELDEVLEKDLAELMMMDVTVTSANKRPQKINGVASAIYVLTQEEIRRSGAANIMEALRLVPGVVVSRIDQNHYAISIRGFNRQFQTKLLVLIDGRTVYAASFAGVFWEAQDTMLEDVDRIEVIRGPGAVLWGSNAVAGVINIITKSSIDTQGALLAGGAGTEENGFVTARYGGKAGDNFTYRVYGKYRDRDSGHRPDNTPAFDGKLIRQGGFRSEWQPNANDLFTMQGDYYNFDMEMDLRNRFVSFTDPFAVPSRINETRAGAHFITRWTRSLDAESKLTVQAYYDKSETRSPALPNSWIDLADLEIQHDFPLTSRQFFSWGINYRFASINIANTFELFSLNPDTHLFGFFVNDEITVIPEKLKVILGAKLEHNEFSGLEVQPHLRAAWEPLANHTLWGAVSRAVRIPTASEEGLRANSASPPVPVVIRVMGDGRSEAEELLAFELGYRAQVTPNFSVDLAGYVNLYKNLIELVEGTFFMDGPTPVVPLIFDNAMEGEVYGAEISAEWKPFSFWRLMANYNYSTVDLRATNPNVISAGFSAEDDIKHLFHLGSYLKISDNMEFDTFIYHRGSNVNRDLVPYAQLDLRFGWKPIPELELSLLGQNLLQKYHTEFTDSAEYRTETERSFTGKITVRF